MFELVKTSIKKELQKKKMSLRQKITMRILLFLNKIFYKHFTNVKLIEISDKLLLNKC